MDLERGNPNCLRNKLTPKHGKFLGKIPYPKYGLQARFQTQNMARTSLYANVARTPSPPGQMGFFSPEAFEYFCLTSVVPSVFQWCLRHAQWSI